MPDNVLIDDTEPAPRTPPPGFVAGPGEKLVHEIVRNYIWGKGQLEHAAVTSQLNRDMVAKFVLFELDGLPASRYWRVRILADLYHLVELLGTFEGLIDLKHGGRASLERSVACTIILYETGEKPYRTRADEDYQGLVAHAEAELILEELTECLGVLGPGTSPDSLQRRFVARMQQLAQRAAADPEAGVELRALEEVRDNEFFLIQESNKARQRLAGFTDPEQLLNELIRVYLDLTDDCGARYLSLWTTRTLRRLAAGRTASVTAAFRRNAAAAAEFSREDSIFCCVRCYNAIEFFGGFLDGAEAAFMAKHRRNQRDVLALVPIHIPATDDVDDEAESAFEDE